MLAAAGLSGDLFGQRLFLIGTLYDPFIARGLDALNYACYQDARFLLVATPSGITLSTRNIRQVERTDNRWRDDALAAPTNRSTRH
jgi:pyruvate dehydrogenase complex dehydrogenase (E1) component